MILDPVYVDTPGKFDHLLDALRAHSVVALDTEFISEGRYEPILCLMQLATPEGIFLLDTLAVRDIRPLWQLLVEPGREVVAVAARHEILFCVDAVDQPPAMLLDLQLAAGLLGYGYPLSHTNLVRRVLDLEVHGTETYSDWKRRPLSASQLRYAADDVRHLHAMRERLLEQAERTGRVAWVRGECERFVATVASGDEKWRIPGSGRMGRRDLAVLRELWRWRDSAARHANAPAGRILRDNLLIEIARRKPATAADLQSLRGLEAHWLRAHAPAALEAVKRALELPDSEWPSIERRDDPPQVGVLTKLLSVATSSLAARFQVDPVLLATTADLQHLVRWRLNPKREAYPDLLRGWRGEILRDALLGLLDGRRSVRVASLNSESPLVFSALDEQVNSEGTSRREQEPVTDTER